MLEWTNKVDGVDDVMAADINSIANAVIDTETELAKIKTTYINSQSDWDSMAASSTWNGAVHVVLNCDITHNGTITVPATVQSIDGRGHMISNAYDEETGEYEEAVSLNDGKNICNLHVYAYSIYGLGITAVSNCKQLTNCASSGFANCTGLYGCAADASEVSAFYGCENLINCTATNSEYVDNCFRSCRGLVNCKAEPTNSDDSYSAYTAGFYACTGLVGCEPYNENNSGYVLYANCSRLTNCTGVFGSGNTYIDHDTCSCIVDTTAASITLYEGMEYRTDSTVLSIAFPSVLRDGYTSALAFTSGGTPTSLSYSSSIYWSGDDLDAYNAFVPAANRRYTVRFWYDGALLRADVCGVHYRYFGTEGALPLTVTNGVQCTLFDRRLSGGVVQDGTPAYNAPVPIEFTGDYDETTGKYLIPITVNGETTTAALDEPLRKVGDYADYIDFKNQKVVRYIQRVVFTGSNYTWGDYGSVWVMDQTLATGMKYGGQSGKNGIWRCTHQPYDSYSDELGFSNANRNRFAFEKTGWGFDADTAAISDFTSYLTAQYEAGTPVEIAYVRQTPYEEALEVPSLQCKRGETVYSSSADVLPSKLYVKYETNLEGSEEDV